MLKIFSVALSLLIIASGHQAFAQQDPGRKILDTKTLSYLENLGTISGTRRGGFEKNFWDGSTREDVFMLLNLLPSQSPSAYIHQFKKRILLSSNIAPQKPENGDVLDGEDYLSLRLQKLVALGFFDEALTLYSKIDTNHQTPSLIMQGLKIMLLNNKLSLACLEMKALTDIPSGDFLEKLNRLCEEEKTNNDSALDVIPVAELALSALDIIQQFQLREQKKINYQKLNGKILHESPAYIIAYFLKDPHFPGKWMEELYVTGFEKGLLSRVQLEDFYEAEGKEDSFFPNRAKALEQRKNEIGEKETLLLFSEFLRYNLEVPRFLENKLKAQNEANIALLPYLKLIKYLEIFHSGQEIDNAAFQMAFSQFNTKEKEILLSLAYSLDIPGFIYNNPAIVYEKLMQKNENTVLPNMSFINMAENILERDDIGLNALTSLIYLSVGHFEKGQPIAFYKALKGLQKVGLTEEARQISKDILADALRKRGE